MDTSEVIRAAELVPVCGVTESSLDWAPQSVAMDTVVSLTAGALFSVAEDDKESVEFD